ncbi:13322_t:CDS:1, partial [Racocetra persica]
SEVSNSYFEKEAIHHYELWMQNAIRRVKRAREIGKKIRAVRVIQRKFIEYYYRPSGLCATWLIKHYKLLWEIREESR